MEAAKLTKFRGKWCVYYRAANVRRDEVVTESKRVSLRTADRAVAERRFEQWKAELKRTDETKVLAAWNVYIEDKGTQRAAYAGLNLLPFFASYDTNDIGLDLCRLYIEHRKSQLTKNGTPPADATIRKELTMLRAALNHAALPGHRDFKIDMPSTPAPRDRYLTRMEFRTFRRSAEKNPRLAIFIELALATAGRKSAILELTWDRVDFKRKLIDLRNPERHAPNKRRALVPMTDRLYSVLLAARETATTKWVLEYQGQRVKNVRAAFDKAMKDAGLEKATPHDPRRTAAVWMAEQGVPMGEIAQYLGHSSTRITEQVYARYSPDYLKGAASALEI